MVGYAVLITGVTLYCRMTLSGIAQSPTIYDHHGITKDSNIKAIADFHVSITKLVFDTFFKHDHRKNPVVVDFYQQLVKNTIDEIAFYYFIYNSVLQYIKMIKSGAIRIQPDKMFINDQLKNLLELKRKTVSQMIKREGSFYYYYKDIALIQEDEESNKHEMFIY